MPRIVSFAYTSLPLLFGVKTVTRRDWDAKYAFGFNAGDVCLAYDRSPRVRGQQIATIKLTAKPTFEPLAMMSDRDYFEEGFDWLFNHADLLPKTIGGKPTSLYIKDWSPDGFMRARMSRAYEWVIKFEVTSRTAYGQQLLDVADRANQLT